MVDCSEKLLHFFRTSETPVLFAGAGVSARAGIPTWSDLLTRLAEHARQYDQYTRHIMIERIQSKKYLDAATYYFLCSEIGEAEKYQVLRSYFETYNANEVDALTSLPFRAIITSNYDRVLHDSYAKVSGRSAIEFSLGDPSLRAASFEKNFFIARVHGRAEVPETIVLDKNHYQKLLFDEAYIGLLTYLFTRTQILFVGFSFFDPAIQHILQVVHKHYGGVHHGRHLALLPEGVGADFIQNLEAYTIQKEFYPNKERHKILWDCFQATKSSLIKTSAQPSRGSQSPFINARSYLASCYTRIKLGLRLAPLRKLVIEGIISKKLETDDKGRVQLGDLSKSIHEELAITLENAELLVNDAVTSLEKDGLCKLIDNYVLWKGKKESLYENAIAALVKGVVDRYVVREGGNDASLIENCISEIFQQLVITRGWDLGAAFAANRPPELVKVRPVIDSILACKSIGGKVKLEALISAVEDLLTQPNSEQAVMLSELGRISFALELITQAPHDSLFHSLTLPEKIYLDANVLMPAITEGHPYQEVYKDTIDNFLKAAASSLTDVRVVVYNGFLNEVCSHRRLAKENIGLHDLKNNEILIKESKFYGAQNLNVFIGAYTAKLATQGSLTFDDYLSQYAPYENESELAQWLKKKGIIVLTEREMLNDAKHYPDILHALEVAYGENNSWMGKNALLIKHDAIQLAALNRDIQDGVRSILVTADRRLRDKIQSGKYSYLGDAMVSHIGLTQLIDLLVGINPSERGFAKLMWSAQISSETEQIRNHLINLALNEYDEAMAKAMHRVVTDIAEDAQIELKRKNLNLNSDKELEKIKVMKALGAFEDRFYVEMRRLIEKDQG